MSEDSDSSSSCESSEESPVEISEIPLPPSMPPTLPVSLPFGWDTALSRGSSNILQCLQQNPNVNLNIRDVQANSININVYNNNGVPNLNPSPEVPKHRSARKKLRKSRSISGHSSNEIKLNDIKAIAPPPPNDSGCKCLALVKNVNDDSNDEPMESASPKKDEKISSRRKKHERVSERVEKHTDTKKYSCKKIKNINKLNENSDLTTKIVSPMKDNKDVKRSKKTIKMTNIITKNFENELENKTKCNSDLKTKPDLSTREDKSVERNDKSVTHTETFTRDQGSQTDSIIMVSKEVQEVLTNLEKHKVIEILHQNIVSPKDDDVIVITDNDTDTQVDTSKNIDEGLMKFIVECSNKNKELVTEMYSAAYLEAFKMFHDDGWSAVWKIMIKAARVSGKKELNEVPATASNTPVMQSTPHTIQSENRQALETSINLLPPPPPPPLPCDDIPLPSMEVSPPLPATPMPPPPLPTSAMPRSAYNVLQHKMLPQQLPQPHKFVIPRISPMLRNILDEQHKEISMQPVLRDYGPTPYTRPTIPQKMAVHRLKRVESVQSARQQLAEHWSCHQMQAINPERDGELGDQVMYAAQAPLPYLPPAYPEPTVMYEHYKKLQKQKGQYNNRSSHFTGLKGTN